MVDACHLLHRISLFLVMDCSSVKPIKTFMNNITRSKSREFKRDYAQGRAQARSTNCLPSYNQSLLG